MAYNLTNVTEATNLYDMAVGVNDLSGGLIMIMVLVSLYIITFIASKGYDTKTALFTAGFVTTIIAVLSFSIGLINVTVFIITLIILLMSLFAILFTE